jgi:hypothetical protein
MRDRPANFLAAQVFETRNIDFVSEEHFNHRGKQTRVQMRLYTFRTETVLQHKIRFQILESLPLDLLSSYNVERIPVTSEKSPFIQLKLHKQLRGTWAPIIRIV